MNATLTKSAPKYVPVRSSRSDQRIFRDAAGNLYAVDHSGTNPTNTDDGPLRLIPTHLEGKESHHAGVVFRVPCIVERTGEESAVSVCLNVARFLALQWAQDFIPVSLRDGEGGFELIQIPA